MILKNLEEYINIHTVSIVVKTFFSRFTYASYCLELSVFYMVTFCFTDLLALYVV